MPQAVILKMIDSAGDAAPSALVRRTDARFLAQLIATRHGLMQTRARKRTAPETGAASYGRAGRTADRRGGLDLRL